MNSKGLQDFLLTQNWYKNMQTSDRLDVLESLCEYMDEGVSNDGQFDLIKSHLEKYDWYDGLTIFEKPDVVLFIQELYKKMDNDLARNLYHACHHAFLHMCGSGSEQSEKDCMKVLQDAIEEYNSIK